MQSGILTHVSMSARPPSTHVGCLRWLRHLGVAAVLRTFAVESHSLRFLKSGVWM